MTHTVDPNIALKRVADSHRRELEDILKRFDGILTPAQMGQYMASINETKAILDKVQQYSQAVQSQPSFATPPPTPNVQEPETEDHTGDFDQPLPEVKDE